MPESSPVEPPAWRRSPLPLLVELAVFFAAFDLCYRLLPKAGWWGSSVLAPGTRIVYRVETPAFLLACAIAYFGLYPALRRWRAGWGLRELGLPRTGWGEALRYATVLLGLELVITSAGLLVIPGLADGLWDAYGRPEGHHLLVFLALVVPVRAALGEEVVFRGYLQGGLQESHRAWGPMIAALAFASLHAFQGVVPLLLFHVPAAVVLGAAYRRTGNLPVFILMHLVYDLIVFTAIWLLAGPPAWSAVLPAGLLAVGLGLLVGLRRTVAQLAAEVVDLLRGLRVGWMRGVFWTAATIAAFLGHRTLRRIAFGPAVDDEGIGEPLLIVGVGLGVLVAVTAWERRRARRAEGG